MSHWTEQTIFYHIYPLGFCGAPQKNDFKSKPVNRLKKIETWIEHLCSLNINAIYLGPVFESSAHGYDTKEYTTVDRRLGENKNLKNLIERLHANGIRVILDAVFHHVGRDFPQFQDLQNQGPNSPYVDWFADIDFNQQSPYGDPFSYSGWHGHFDLVKLNLSNKSVRNHIFEALQHWIKKFDIDGIRLDAADCIDKNFLQQLSQYSKSLKPDFWLMGEVVHGDYRQWTQEAGLDSVTNYECYKGLWSSFNDSNFFEIAYSLNRQFSKEGIYKNDLLYSFIDNHDVNRIASTLKNPTHLHPLYCLLFTIPGPPSIYYGSEFGVTGKKQNGHDHDLRPALELSELIAHPPAHELYSTIQKLSNIRKQSKALQEGNYQELHIDHKQFAFMRATTEEAIIVLINADSSPQSISFNKNSIAPGTYYDLLNKEAIELHTDKTDITSPPNWGRILIKQI